MDLTFEKYIKEGWNSQTLEMKEENNFEKTFWDKMKSNWRVIFLFFLILTSFLVFVLFLSTHLSETNETSYKDCYEINYRNNLEDGIYRLDLNGTKVWTFCRNGSTLIQQRNPRSGNNKIYFNRLFKEYRDGFGFTEKEFFLGLENVLHLNIDGNNVLQIEGIRQDDGTKIMVEFNNFTMLKEAHDNIRYYFQIRNQIEYYPIISLGAQTSPSDKEGNYIFINPSYLKDVKTKIEERSKYEFYHDLFYAGFKTLDMDKNYQCSRKYKTGNWFPYGIEKDPYSKIIQETCQHTFDTTHTNLNGVYDQDMKKNERQIILCNRPKVEDCFVNTYSKYGEIRGVTLNYTTTIKLSETRMWLKRP